MCSLFQCPVRKSWKRQRDHIAARLLQEVRLETSSSIHTMGRPMGRLFACKDYPSIGDSRKRGTIRPFHRSGSRLRPAWLVWMPIISSEEKARGGRIARLADAFWGVCGIYAEGTKLHCRS